MGFNDCFMSWGLAYSEVHLGTRIKQCVFDIEQVVLGAVFPSDSIKKVGWTDIVRWRYSSYSAIILDNVCILAFLSDSQVIFSYIYEARGVISN